MTETQKIEALTKLLDEVIYALEMKRFDIEDANESYQCEVEADEFYQKMSDILHSNQ